MLSMLSLNLFYIIGAKLLIWDVSQLQQDAVL